MEPIIPDAEAQSNLKIHVRLLNRPKFTSRRRLAPRVTRALGHLIVTYGYSKVGQPPFSCQSSVLWLTPLVIVVELELANEFCAGTSTYYFRFDAKSRRWKRITGQQAHDAASSSSIDRRKLLLCDKLTAPLETTLDLI